MSDSDKPETAGYILGNIVSAKGPPPPEMVPEFMAMVKTLDKSFGLEKIFIGPALKQYELGAGKPNSTFIVKFASKAKALEFYKAEAYLAWKEKFITGEIGRDLRVLEAPADLFKPGKAYWFALIHNVIDPEAMGKYFGSFFAKGFKINFDFVGPSDFFEAAKEFVPEKKDGKPFFNDLTTDLGIVVVAEIVGGHEVGATFRDNVEYKNALLESLDQTYTTEEKYAEQTDEFMEKVLRRDLRIIGIPE